MNEDQLIKILREEEADAASYYDSELAQVQADAMDRYHAKKYGDEVDGRSQVVTHDIEDTINWVMPHLMRTFLESDELVICEDDGLDDGDPSLKIAADYLHHVFFKDNPGSEIIHDFAFDGLLQRTGVARLGWKDPDPSPPKIIEGVPLELLTKYVNDPEYEILEAEQRQVTMEPAADTEAGEQDEPPEPGEPPSPTQPAGPTAAMVFDIKVRRTPQCGRACIETIPPEQFRITRRAKSIEDADYHGWKSQVFLAEIVREFPGKRRELDPSMQLLSAKDDGDAELATDARAESRFPDEPTTAHGSREDWNSLGRKKVWQNVEYLRCDYDGDGIVELRRVRRVGNVILENDAVDESEFVAWSPIRVAHRLIGRSLADTLLDLQKIRTVLTRSALDGFARSLAPRTVVNRRMATTSTMDQVLDHDIGAVIEVEGPVAEALREIVSPDVSTPALAAIEYFDRRSEEASGVSRHAQGIAPDAITKTASGIDMLQAAANSRIELVARWMGLGLQELFEKLLRMLMRYQDGPRMVKLSGKRVEVDPRRWSDEMAVTVHVGMAAESREKKLFNLNILAQKQEQILLQAGPSNPIVGFAEYRQTLSQMTEAMGFKNATRFFKEIPEGYQPPPPGPDPKMAEVQQKGQIAQAELQQKGQLQAAELQHEQQLAEIDAQAKAQQVAAKAEADKEAAAIKLHSEMQINTARLAMEERLAVMRMQQEKELALLKMEREHEVAMIAAKNKAAVNGGGSSDGGDGGSYRPGGRLDA